MILTFYPLSLLLDETNSLYYFSEEVSRGILPYQGIKPRSRTVQEDSLPAEPHGKGKATHSRSLAWRFHGLYSPWGWKELDMTE